MSEYDIHTESPEPAPPVHQLPRVIALANQKVFRMIDENTSVVETFKITNDVIRFTRTDGKGYGTYKIISLSADKKVLNVKLGTSAQVWKKK